LCSVLCFHPARITSQTSNPRWHRLVVREERGVLSGPASSITPPHRGGRDIHRHTHTHTHRERKEEHSLELLQKSRLQYYYYKTQWVLLKGNSIFIDTAGNSSSIHHHSEGECLSGVNPFKANSINVTLTQGSAMPWKQPKCVTWFGSKAAIVGDTGNTVGYPIPMAPSTQLPM
jgi:hypothetical protein